VYGPAGRKGAVILEHLSNEVVAIALTALISAPVVAIVRRVLGAPRVVEPFLVPRDG
jgi:hypothetical protein